MLPIFALRVKGLAIMAIPFQPIGQQDDAVLIRVQSSMEAHMGIKIWKPQLGAPITIELL